MIGRGGLEEGLREFRAGKLTFDEFVRTTRHRWQDIAALLYKRWDLPAWISVEDLEQELLMAAWKYVWRCDGKRTKRGVEWYVIWNGLHQSQKIATKARIGRRPHRGEGKNVLSCYEIPASAFVTDDVSYEFMVDRANVPATQEQEVLRRVFFERLAHQSSGGDRLVFAALAANAGNAEAAGATLYGNAYARRMLDLDCEDDAVVVATKVLGAAVVAV